MSIFRSTGVQRGVRGIALLVANVLVAMAVALGAGPEHGIVFKFVLWLLFAPIASWLICSAIGPLRLVDLMFWTWIPLLVTIASLIGLIHLSSRLADLGVPWAVGGVAALAVLGSSVLCLRAFRNRRSRSRVPGRRERLVGLLGLLLTLSIVTPMLSPGPHTRARFVAGPGARDCGVFERPEGDVLDGEELGDVLPPRLKEVARCIHQARRDKQGFVFTMTFYGMDSDLASGLVGHADGRVSRFSYDHMSCDIAGFCATLFDVRPCKVGPEVVEVDPNTKCERRGDDVSWSSVW